MGRIWEETMKRLWDIMAILRYHENSTMVIFRTMTIKNIALVENRIGISWQYCGSIVGIIRRIEDEGNAIGL